MKIETLQSREMVQRTTARQPMAARAVALCEGCPMARFCQAKSTGECPPDIATDAGGYEQPRSESYSRDKLFDDRINSLFAAPVIKPALPQQSPKPPRAAAPPPQSQPPQQQMRRERPRGVDVPRKGETIPDKLAAIITGIFSIQAIKTARGRK